MLGASVVILLLAGCAIPLGSRQPSEPTPKAPSPTQTGCISRPSRCGYPDGTNTGVQDRTSLRRVPADVTEGPGWSWDPRGWLQETGDGAVVENLEVSGPIDVKGKNVTVRNNVIVVSGDTWGVALRHTTNATISGNTIGAPATTPRLMVGIKDIYDDSVGTTVVANDIAGASTGIQMGAGVIRDNYIHDLELIEGDHINGITSNGVSRRLEIDHNTILNSFPQTDAIGLFQDFGVEADRLITRNLLAGGGYVIYGGDNQRFGVTHDIKIIGNRFSKIYFPTGGYYGPLAAFDNQGVGNAWTDNTWDEDGSPV